MIATLLLATALADNCEFFTPSSSELRDDRPAEAWSSAELRGRRWSASVLGSAGGETAADGYEAGRCVVGTWTIDEPLPRGGDAALCRQRCRNRRGCLGVLFGPVEGPHGPEPHCFLAGVGHSSTLLQYPCLSPLHGCPEAVQAEELPELAGTLQCWQRKFQRCQSQVKRPGAADAEGSERMAGGLEDLRTRLKALPLYGSTAAKGTIKLLAHPGRLLRVLGSVCQLLGHVADDVDDAVAHCLNAARTALEGTHSSLALSLLGLPILSWLAARLASWCRQQPSPVTEGQVLYPHVVSSIALGSQTWSGGFSQPVPCRRASLCTAGPIPPESADEQSSADAVDSDWPPYESRSLGHVSDSEAVSPDLAKRRNLTPPRPRRLLLHSPGIQEVPESEKEMPPKAPKAVPLSKRLKRIDEAGEAIPLATRLQQRLAASREEAGGERCRSLGW